MDNREGRHMHGSMAARHAHIHREDPTPLLSSLIPNHVEAIADIGCGSGFYSKYFLKYSDKVYCVEIDSESIKIANEELKDSNAVLLNESAERMSIPSNSVDIVFMANSFHDMDDKEAVVSEVSRILKPDGKVIIIDWKKDSKFGPPQQIKMSEDDYAAYFKGFRLLKKLDIEPQHYCLLFSR